MTVLAVCVADGKSVKVNATLSNVRLEVTTPKRTCVAQYQHRVSAITSNDFK